MHDQIFIYVLLAGLAIGLMRAAFTDLKSRTISNRLNIAVAALAPLFWWTSALPLWPDVMIQLGMAAMVFALSSLFFAMQQMGGGDVKLLTALTLWFPPNNFGMLIVIMALAGWVLTLIMGIWSVAHSQATDSRPVRDTLVLGALTLIAGIFASVILGGYHFTLPATLTPSLAPSGIAFLLIAILPVALLALVTLAAVRIIRRHNQQLRIPYGLAIAIGGLWAIGNGLIANSSPFAFS